MQLRFLEAFSLAVCIFYRTFSGLYECIPYWLLKFDIYYI